MFVCLEVRHCKGGFEGCSYPALLSTVISKRYSALISCPKWSSVDSREDYTSVDSRPDYIVGSHEVSS